MIEAEVQIKKAIKIVISNDDDVDDFLDNLKYLFEGLPKEMKEKDAKGQCITYLDTAHVFSTFHKIWLEVKENAE